MMDPFGSIQNFMNQFMGFVQNPAQLLVRKLNLPQNALDNPSDTIQQLMNSGRMTQQQYNQLKKMAGQIQNNPMFQQMLKK